ncbi:MAG: hypothetical protein JNK73_13205 [Bacteroidia bacterium]|nr:hypothetical protein [Bacteroidia bacterium]
MQEKDKTGQKAKSIEDLVKENQAKLPDWKERHKTVKSILVMSKFNGPQPYIIGKPTAYMLDAIRKYEADGKPSKSQELLKNSCVLAGDTTLFSQDVDLENAVMNKVADLLERLEVEEKEL